MNDVFARTTDPDTSHEATHFNPTEVEQRILDAIADRVSGMTCHEVVIETGLPIQTVSPRFKPLHKKGWLEYHPTLDGKELQKRPGRSGRRQLVHFLKNRAPFS